MGQIVAALLWKKSKINSISTVIFEEDSMEIISQPKIKYLAPGFFRFRKETNIILKQFFSEIFVLNKLSHFPVRIEYKIVFLVPDIPYLRPAKESKHVYKIFLYWLKKAEKKIPQLYKSPQLRSKLTGKDLKRFNREIRAFGLVSRKHNTRYQYNLWAVALHATAESYIKKLEIIRAKLLDAFYRNEN